MKTFFARWAVACFLVVIFLAASWSLFHPRLFRVHDYIHGARIVELQRALADGQFPVRWTANFGYGYGMPLFEFYAPLPSYVGATIYTLTFFNLAIAVRALFLIANAGTVLGGYFLGKKLFDRTGGIFVSAALTLAPYRAVNLFVRGALSEVWAVMFLPWIVYFGLGVLEEKERVNTTGAFRRAFAGLVLSLAGLMLSHNLTTLMFVPLSFVFLISFDLGRNIVSKSKKWFHFDHYFWLTVSYLLAGGLSTFYMLPAVLEKNFTQINSLISGYFHYSYHFLYIRQFLQPNWAYGGSTWGPEDDISFFLGWGQWVGLALAAVVGLFQIFRLWKQRRAKSSMATSSVAHLLLMGLSGIFAGAALYLSLLKSQWLWDALGVLGFIQFPWRWLSVAIVFVALIIGAGSHSLKYPLLRWGYAALVIVGLLINAQYFRPERYLTDDAEYYYADPARIRAEMSTTLPDFMPIALRAGQPIDHSDTDLTGYLPPRTEDQFLIGTYSTLEKFEVVTNRGHEKTFHLNVTEPTKIILATAYFPGWQARIDGGVVPEKDLYVTEQGLIQLEVPAGEHEMEIFFGRTPVRLLADVISLFALVVFLLSMVRLHQAHE